MKPKGEVRSKDERAREIGRALRASASAVPDSIDSAEKLADLLTGAGPELMLRAMERLITPKQIAKPRSGLTIEVAHVESDRTSGPGSVQLEPCRERRWLNLYVLGD